MSALEYLIGALTDVQVTSTGHELTFQRDGDALARRVLFGGIDNYAAFDSFAVAYCCAGGVLLTQRDLPEIRYAIRQAILHGLLCDNGVHDAA